MKIEDTYRYMIAGRFGIELIEEYKLKEYILIEVDKYIKDFIDTNDINFDIEKVKEEAISLSCGCRPHRQRSSLSDHGREAGGLNLSFWLI